MIEHRPPTASSPLHSSALGLRRSMERNLERQPSKNLKFLIRNSFFCYQI
jgi:hypothetical protein